MALEAVGRLGIVVKPGGVEDPHHPLTITHTAHRGNLPEAIIPILPETIDTRRSALAALVDKGKGEGRGNLVTPGGVDTLAAIFGRDVVEETLARGVISRG